MNSSSTEAQLTVIRENAISSVKMILKCMEINPKRTMKSIYEEISVKFNVSVSILKTRMRKYREGGWQALNPKHGGRSSENSFLLDLDMVQQIQEMIIDHTPDQMKMPFALWTRKAIQELIHKKFGIWLSIACIGNYLRRWGFTYQRPKQTTFEQQSAAVQRWLEGEYRSIRAQAKRENAEICWGDETVVQNIPHHLRGFSPKGQTPVMKSFEERIHLTMISEVNNQGAVRFRIFREAINAERFKSFMESMIHDAAGRKTILIVDNFSVHHANDLKGWLKENEEKIELRFLPSY